jgi:hypothetical protein
MSAPAIATTLDYEVVTDQTGAATTAPENMILAHNRVQPASAWTKQGAKASGSLPSSRRGYGSFAIADGARIWVRTAG